MSIDLNSADSVHSSVQNYYGKVLQKTEDLRTSACTLGKKETHPVYVKALANVPHDVNERFYGCGNPVPLGIKGLHVLDLGSGSGRDCYVAAQLTGEEGFVTGVDMTQEQLDVANKCVDEFITKVGYSKPNLRFVKGYIEFLQEAGVAPNSQDLVISNCVVNLSPNKKQVLQGVYDVLKVGGEFYFSDVYLDRRLPDSVRSHDVLYGECASGALYKNDFLHLAKEVGFGDPRQVSISEIDIWDPEMRELLGDVRFYSITYRLFKIPERLEPQCEDYGQYAIYKGTLPGYTHSYVLDDHHKFEANKPTLVCGNTASMLSETWLAPYFTVVGDRNVHYGEFPCGPTVSDDVTSKKLSCC
jgi:SAM-dependent methyltransferase